MRRFAILWGALCGVCSLAHAQVDLVWEAASSLSEHVKDSAPALDGGRFVLVREQPHYANERNYIVKLDDQGQLDATFGNAGFFELPSLAVVANRPTRGASLVVDEDGSLYVAAIADQSGSLVDDAVVIRVTPDGQWDSSFGQGGLVRVDLEVASFAREAIVTLSPAGQIVLVTLAGNTLRLTEYTPDGVLSYDKVQPETYGPVWAARWYGNRLTLSTAQFVEGEDGSERRGLVAQFDLLGEPAEGFGVAGKLLLDSDCTRAHQVVEKDGELFALLTIHDVAVIRAIVDGQWGADIANMPDNVIFGTLAVTESGAFWVAGQILGENLTTRLYRFVGGAPDVGFACNGVLDTAEVAAQYSVDWRAETDGERLEIWGDRGADVVWVRANSDLLCPAP